ncbi:MAG: hypothetical protein AAF851_06260 [Myxococcota bacterium]
MWLCLHYVGFTSAGIFADDESFIELTQASTVFDRVFVMDEIRWKTVARMMPSYSQSKD